MEMKVLHNTCNMSICDLPDMNALVHWALGLWSYMGIHIRQIPHAHATTISKDDTYHLWVNHCYVLPLLQQCCVPPVEVSKPSVASQIDPTHTRIPYVLPKALLLVCMVYTVQGESQMANIAQGKAECYICHETLIKSCIYHTNWWQCFKCFIVFYTY